LAKAVAGMSVGKGELPQRWQVNRSAHCKDVLQLYSVIVNLEKLMGL